MKCLLVPSLFALVLSAACSSSTPTATESSAGQSNPPSDLALTTNTTPPSSTSSTTSAPIPTSTSPMPVVIECDVDDPEPSVHRAPIGSEIVLIARSPIEREFHLHGYDLELAGREVTFRFMASLPGDHEVTEHPDHTIVCIISS